MRRLLLGVLLGAAIVGGGAALYGVLFHASVEEPEWSVASFSGGVSVSLGGGGWQDVEVRMRLGRRDRVRTTEDGEATLLHGASHVTVRARTEIQVAALTEESSKFQVSSGVVYIEARGDRIGVRTTSGASVDATDAGVGMAVNDDGHVLVQVKRGSADFSSMGRTEHVREGQEARALPGQPPTRPVAIPQVLLLNVRFPDADTFNSRLARIEGRTEPGHRVTVGGRWVDVGADGTFSAAVEMEEGVNQIDVAATDPLGRTRVEHSRPIRVDTTAPGLSGASIGSRPVSVAPAERASSVGSSP